MKRIEIERWLDQHHESVRGHSRDVLERYETDVRHHARELAWQHAREVAEASLRRFRTGFGLPASEGFVARELCHELARELRHHEPHPEHPVPESEWLAPRTLSALGPNARRMLGEWLEELAEHEEHEAWKEIVSFTDHFAPTLIRRAHMTGELSWDFDRSYPKLATKIGRMILQEYEDHIRTEMERTRADRSLH